MIEILVFLLLVGYAVVIESHVLRRLLLWPKVFFFGDSLKYNGENRNPRYRAYELCNTRHL